MEQWITGYMIGESADYVVSKIANTLKQAYHDRAIGKKPPTPEEFKKMLHISGSAVTASSAKGA